METKGRRGFRATGPINAPAEAAAPIAAPDEPAAQPDAIENTAPELAAQPDATENTAPELAAQAEAAEAVVPEFAAVAEPVDREEMAETVVPPRAALAKSFPGEHDVFAALAESQAVLARGLEALSNEMAGLARSEIDAAARSATEMLGVRTLVDAIEVNAGFARSSFDSWLESSARLSELGVTLAAEASRPLLAQLGKGWASVPRSAF